MSISLEAFAYLEWPLPENCEDHPQKSASLNFKDILVRPLLSSIKGPDKSLQELDLDYRGVCV